MGRVARSLLLAFSLALGSTSALAQETPPPADACEGDADTCGRKAFEKGIDAYKADKFNEAAEHFKKAYELRPHPIVLFNLALAQARIELYVEAVEGFEKTLADPETPKDLRAKIKEEKSVAERKLSTIEVDGGADSEVFVDEKPAPGQPARVRVNPGDHKVRVTSKGRELTNRTIHVATGERVNVSVDRTREVVVDNHPKPKPKPVKKPPPTHGLSPIWFYVSAGATVVLGGVTTWSALDTKRSYDDYKRDLPQMTQSEVNERVDDGHAKELRTNVLLGATAIAAAGTAVLGIFLVDWKSGNQRTEMGLRVGPRGVSAVGRF